MKTNQKTDDNFPRVRHKVGEVDFDCPNCNRHLHRTLWAEATEFYKTRKGNWKPTKHGFDFVSAFAYCDCGAQILVADDYEKLGLYWLNEEKLTGASEIPRTEPPEEDS